jgi:GNAT superfamily N-acetyltransferase
VAGDFNIARDGFTIHAANERGRTLRMLLSQLSEDAAYLVAVEGKGRRVIGAAGMTQSCRPQPYPGPGILIEVIEPCRGHGVGRALLSGIVELARQAFQADAVYAAHRVELGSVEMDRWKWMHFEPIETVQEHSLPIKQFESRLGPMFERMRAKGHIPTGAKIVPLYQANAAAVMQLHLDHMGGNRRELYEKLRGHGVGVFHPRYSRVLLVDGRIRGCVLAHRADKHTARVDANIVDLALRGGWANVWLKLEASRHALALGIKQFTFTSFDHYTDTRSFSEKLGGTATRTTALMVRRFAGPDVPEGE